MILSVVEPYLVCIRTVLGGDLLGLGSEADAGVLEAEEGPGLGLEAVAVEAGQRHVGAVQLHRAAQHHA